MADYSRMTKAELIAKIDQVEGEMKRRLDENHAVLTIHKDKLAAADSEIARLKRGVEHHEQSAARLRRLLNRRAMREAYLQGQIDEIRGNELVRRRDLAPPSEGLLRDIVDEIDGGADLERPNSGIVSDAYDQVMRGRR